MIGTLTKNEQTVCEIYTVDETVFIDRTATLANASPALKRTLQVGSICNNAVVNVSGKFVGQSTDVALLNVLPFFGLLDQRVVRTVVLYTKHSNLIPPLHSEL